jgi:hypothetical protein
VWWNGGGGRSERQIEMEVFEEKRYMKVVDSLTTYLE